MSTQEIEKNNVNILTTSYFLLVLLFLYVVYFVVFQNILHHGDFNLHAGFINNPELTGYSLLTRGGKVIQYLGLGKIFTVLTQIKILAVLSIFGRWVLSYFVTKKIASGKSSEIEILFFTTVLMLSLNFWGINIETLKIERFETALLFFFNDWHNPTVLPANFFTVLLGVLLFDVNEKEWALQPKNWALIILTLYLGYHFKPSFFTSLSGALFFLLIIFWKFIKKSDLKNYLLLFVFSLLVFLAIKAFTPFLSSENIKLKFSFFDFLLNSTRLKKGQSLFFILLNFTFPFIILMQTYFRRKNKDFHIWLFFSLLALAGYFQPMFISEPGERLNHSNFRWSSFSVYAFVAPYSIGLGMNAFKNRSKFYDLKCLPFYIYSLCFLSGLHWMVKYVILGEYYNA